MTINTQTIYIKDLVNKINLQHIAIIMDGNRRWAKQKYLPSISGHNEGVKALKKMIENADEFGLKYVTVYAFSTENWNRKKEEVDFLMNLLADTLKKELKALNEKNVKIRIIGDLNKLNNKLQDVLYNSMEQTIDNNGVNLQIAINYGGRNEIIDAVKTIAQQVKENTLNIEDIDESVISKNLYTYSIPDPDLLIRTGGEKRVSNYLLWQIAYSEFYITDVLWPDFDKTELQKAILNFADRDRRFGGN